MLAAISGTPDTLLIVAAILAAVGAVLAVVDRALPLALLCAAVAFGFLALAVA